MSAGLQGFMRGLKAGEPASHRNLTIFPLFVPPSPGLGYLLLSEALSAGLVEITETSESGSVPNLKVVNRADRMVLILDGEELVGAKQNRVVNTTILIAAGTAIVIPVTCVEQGRWAYAGKSFTSEERVLPSRLRADKQRQVANSLRMSNNFAADQSAIWDGISAKMSKLGARSRTLAMADVYRSEAGRLDDFSRRFECADGQAGALVAIDGRIVGLDAFGEPETYARVHRKLVESYALDAVEAPESARSVSVGADQAEAFVRALAGARCEDRPGVGLGTDFRIEAPGLSGFALTLGEHVLHLAAFSSSNESVDRNGPGFSRMSQRRTFRR